MTKEEAARLLAEYEEVAYTADYLMTFTYAVNAAGISNAKEIAEKAKQLRERIITAMTEQSEQGMEAGLWK